MTQPSKRLADVTMRAAFTASTRPSAPSGGKGVDKAGSKQSAANDHVTSTRLNWHVLGGNNQNRIGANCGLCVYDETLSDGSVRKRALLFDAGVLAGDPRAAEDPSLADCDSVIPDLTPYLYKKDDPSHVPEVAVDSIYLTHSHADHLGALPFMLMMGYQLPKVYATPYTAKRLQQELTNAGIAPADWPQIFTIAPGKAIEEGPATVTAFWVSHSTPQSVGFFIETPEGNILNPGDFKLDQSVLWGPAFSQAQLNRIIGDKKVDLLLLDSTGADRDVTPITESDVRNTLREVMAEYPNKRIVIAVMSGFEENLASIGRVTAEMQRDLWVAGWSHEQSLDALAQTGMSLQDRIGLPLNVRVVGGGKAARDLAATPAKQSVIVVTGAQGTPHSALTRAVDGTHNAITLDPKNDIVLFCAPSVPGQEAGRYRLLAQLRQKGIPFLTRQDKDLYSHAHARLPELRDMANLIKPSTLVPIHGDARLRAACGEAMKAEGHRVLAATNGDQLRVSRKKGLTVASRSEHGQRLIGFKTLQGNGWQDKYYTMVRTSDRKGAANDAQAPKRPRIFDIGK